MVVMAIACEFIFSLFLSLSLSCGRQGHHEVVATLLKSFDPPEEQDEGEDEEENHLKSSVAAAAESLEVENIDR